MIKYIIIEFKFALKFSLLVFTSYIYKLTLFLVYILIIINYINNYLSYIYITILVPLWNSLPLTIRSITSHKRFINLTSNH